MRRIRILLVDDNPNIREGITALLEREPDLEIVGEAGDGQAAVQMAHDLNPDIVIMDISMPGINGIAATQHITVGMPQVRVIGLSLRGEEAMAQAMLQIGASAYVSKSQPSDQLIDTIRTVVSRYDA